MRNLAAIITRNVFSKWVGLVIEAATAFALAPFIVRQIGDTGYGIFALVTAFTGYFGLLSLGFRPAINKYVAEYSAIGDYDRLNQVVSVSLGFYTVMAGLVLAASVGLSQIITDAFRVPLTHAAEARTVTVVIGIQIAITLPGLVVGGVLSGLQRYDLQCAIGSSTTLLRTAALFVSLQRSPSILTLALVNLCTHLIAQALTIAVARKISPSLRFQVTAPRGPIFALLLRYSGTALVITLAGRLIHYADALVIAYFLPVSAVTPFVIATNVADLGRNAILETSSVLNPAASQLQATRDTESLQAMLEYGTKMLLLLIIPLTIGFIIFGGAFIELWMGKHYAISAEILAVLALGQLFSLPQTILRTMLSGMGELRFMAYTTAVEGSLNFLLSIILVNHYGLLGVAWGTTIPAILVALFGLPRVVCRLLGVPVWSHIRRSYLAPVCTSVAFLVCALLLTHLLPPLTWVAFVADCTISSLVFLGIASIATLESTERRRLSWMLREAFGLRQSSLTRAPR